ncbi:MAG TPA: fused MFS/spermidine synthase [Xanthobacteraceae bacterium]|nr:fused MFS/spermidine synthase [Xanthobacteraceae bacterium]
MAPEAAPPRPALILAAFTAAVFLSALLLFAVEPMFARMVLPTLGGSPSVWSVAMVFFQAMLLAGYAYAHVLMRARVRTVPLAVHGVLLIAAGLSLPIAVATGWGDPPERFEALWLLGLFAASIGLPFLALSANTSLLQAWFVRTGHAEGHDPYFLYAASNVGSFLALLSYPAIVEPLLTLHAQALIWTGGFWLLFALIAACGLLMLRAPAPVVAAEAEDAAPAVAPRDFAFWVLLAAVPSGLLVAVTAYISTDIAAAPLLWVIPLALYLLTFVLAFARRALLPHRVMLVLQPLTIAGLIAVMAFPFEHLAATLAAHLLAFFLIALASHGELARRRPPSRHLTTFYLALALGGALGGLFAGLIAPRIFSWVAEYPILIALAALCRPFPAARPRLRWELLIWAAVVIAAAVAVVPSAFAWLPHDDAAVTALNEATVALALGGALVAYDPPKFALATAAALAMLHLYPVGERQAHTVRSFFGVYKIYDTPDGRFRVLQNGTTIHGAERLKDADYQPVGGRPEPLTYYGRGFGMARTIAAVRARKGGPVKVAIVGLGTGSLACYREPGEDWTIFEIDVTAIGIARDSHWFDFIPWCAPKVPIVLGDARRMIAREPDGRFDVIIVDAFSSDTIPIHLITREAMALYRAKVAPHGVVVMHVSNRYLELSSVVAGIAAANGLRTWVTTGEEATSDDDNYVFSSDVVIAAEQAGDLGELAGATGFDPLAPTPAQRVWTDDYSNIVGALWRK